MKRCSQSLKVTEKEQDSFLQLFCSLPQIRRTGVGCFLWGIYHATCLSIQLGVIMVSTVQNPLAKSAIVKV